MRLAPRDSTTRLRYALEGRVVTMDPSDRVLERGTIYVDGDRIVAVTPTDSPAPPGYEDVPLVRTGGTIYPGLIELHNHLSYNVLPLWDVPRRYTNRDQWSGTTAYRERISGPMKVLGQIPGYVEAIVRYVECKCLLGGVTTSQGLALYSNQGIKRYYRGIVRNVEQPEHEELPGARTSISDIEAVNAGRFLDRLRQCSCLLLHLSEGVDARARQRFHDLRLPDGSWAIAPSLAGIHCLALDAGDFEILGAHGGSMVWSPLSNMLLYGSTADVRTAKALGLRIGLGSDWSPSGSKNLLWELKVARLVSDTQGGIFSDRELLAMVTRDAAAILRWDRSLGSIEPGKFADLFVVAGRRGDPYAALLEARETQISLVIIDGVPRCGRPSLMSHFGPGTESWRIGQARRILNLAQENVDPAVGALTLREARDRLRDGLRRLPELALELEQAAPRAVEGGPPQWFLLLEQEEPVDAVLRPYLAEGLEGLQAERGLLDIRALAIPLSQLLGRLSLDPLTVPDDEHFLTRLCSQPNLPDPIKEGLAALA